MDKKVIGFILANWEGEKIALDLYEGNMIISPDGKKMKIDASVYNKYEETYKGTVANDKQIGTAYNWNRDHQIKQHIPDESADPLAAEKEYAIRLKEIEAEKARVEQEKALEKEREAKRLAEEEQRLREEERQFEEEQKRIAEEEQKKKEEEEQRRLQLEAEQKAEEERIAKLKKEAEERAAEEERKKREEEERKAEEERLRLEAEQKAEEERKRLEAEQKAEEERKRLEAEQKAEEERKRLEAEQKAEEERKRLEAEQKAEEERKQQEADRKAEEKRKKEEAAKQKELEKQQAAEEKKKAAEEKKRAAEEKKAADAKAKQEAADAKKKAAEEKKRLKEEAKAAKKAEKESSEPDLPEVAALKRKTRALTGVIALLVILILGGGYYVYSNNGFTPVAGNNNQAEQPDESADVKDEYVVAKLAKDVPMSQAITADDVTGVIVSSEQYNKYNSQTYIASDGSSKYMNLILYDDVNDVIGKYAAADLKEGDLLYDTNVSNQHVVAEKTYVDATINGEDGTYEVDADSLKGNTDIKIVAVITTDGGEPVQVLLSRMTLQDRSLENIFNAAGQDILEQLANPAQSQDEEAEQTADDAEAAEE